MTPSTLLHPLKLDVVGFQEEEHDYHFRVELPEPNCCQSCGTLHSLVKFGKDDQAYRDVPIHDKRVTIWIIRRRYKCNSCSSTFRPELKDMDDRRMMTRRLVKHIEKAALLGTNSEVARSVGVDEKTVRLIFEEFYKAKSAAYKPTAPRVLGIDELYLGRAYRAIFTNIDQSTVIDLLPNRNKPNIVHFLAHLPQKKGIEIVCTDMWNPYREATREVLPQASLVVDKFHVTRMANEAMETIRKGLKSSLTAPQRKTLKGDRKLLLMRRHDLKPWQQLTMETWLNAFPDLSIAYNLKEGFYDVWEAKCDREAKDRYSAWKSNIPASQKDAWAPLVTAMTNWEAEILAYFKPGHQFTNAFTESSNRGVKTKQRDARGMKFESYRAKVLFSQEHKVVKPKPRRQSPFVGMARMYVSDFDLWEKDIDYGVPISTVMRLLEDGEL